MRRYRVDALGDVDDELVLDEAASHHCLVVCQTPRGTRVAVYDASHAADAELAGTVDGRAVLRQLTPPSPVGLAAERVLVAGLSRKPVVERLLRMGTELGVTEFRLFVASRSVAKGLHVDRWMRIVESATQQCGRVGAPLVTSLPGLTEALVDLPPLPRFVLSPGEADWRPAQADAVLLTGPEGGFTPLELELAIAHGFAPAGLGPWVLRADTAAVAALARLPTR